MQIQEFQRLMAQLYGERDRQRGSLGTFQWLVEEIGELAEALRKHVPSKIEEEVAAEYDRAAKEVEEADLKKLLLRIRDHEVYHTEVFSDLLKEEKEK